MKQLATITAYIIIMLFSCNNEQANKEKIIKEYFSGWQQKNWDAVEKNLAPEFTFTSPNKDDHISIKQFKEKCWEQANYIKRFDFIRFAEDATGAYVTYELFTSSNASFRNTEYFDFDNGKIKSIEVFFGTGRGAEGFPSNQK